MMMNRKITKDELFLNFDTILERCENGETFEIVDVGVMLVPYEQYQEFEKFNKRLEMVRNFKICSCLTATSDIKYHDPECNYRKWAEKFREIWDKF